ncbi:MAG: response regulator transcription factor [Clostridia bacterium]|nr:response regulator transcription factor [Clostridia bacterium]
MKTIRIAVVEDESANALQIEKFIALYAKNNKIPVELLLFSDGESFLKHKESFDVVFMDIELPGIDGITCSKNLRKRDKGVLIVFITNLSQLAIRGYEVSAFDFIVKPVLYSDFCFKLQRVFAALQSTNGDAKLKLENRETMEIVSIAEIVYVEILNHNLIYHLTTRDFVTKGRLADVEEQLKPYHFLKCNRCYLVNPAHIKTISGFNLSLTTANVTISRPQKASFLREFNEYLLKSGL